MAILLNGWILPTGGVASGKVCPAACAAGFFLTFFTYSIILPRFLATSAKEQVLRVLISRKELLFGEIMEVT